MSDVSRGFSTDAPRAFSPRWWMHCDHLGLHGLEVSAEHMPHRAPWCSPFIVDARVCHVPWKIFWRSTTSLCWKDELRNQGSASWLVSFCIPYRTFAILTGSLRHLRSQLRGKLYHNYHHFQQFFHLWSCAFIFLFKSPCVQTKFNTISRFTNLSCIVLSRVISFCEEHDVEEAPFYLGFFDGGGFRIFQCPYRSDVAKHGSWRSENF